MSPVAMSNLVKRAESAALLAKKDPSALTASFVRRCCSLWAETERKIKREPFTFTGREYWLEPHDIQTEKLVISTGAQMGKTNLWMNRTLHEGRYESRSCFILFPTGGAASVFSSGKFQEAIEGSPDLSSFFTDIDNVGHKRAGSVEFFIRSAVSKKGAMLQTVTADNVVVDEMDRCEDGAVEQALHRRAGVERKGLILVSTPTVPDSGIDYEFRNSDGRLYFVRCPRCNSPQALEFKKNIEWNETIRNERERWDSARYVCASCRGIWSRADLRRIVSLGEWIPQNRDNAAVGYGGLGQIYSPTVTASELVEQFEKADEAETKREIFFRFADGRAYAGGGSKLSDEELRGARGKYTSLETSEIGSVLGLDIGPPHWAVVAEYPQGPDALMKIIAVRQLRKFEEADELMRTFKVRCAVVDANPEREKAQEFVSRFPGRAFMAFYPWDIKLKRVAEFDDEDKGTYNVKLHRTFWIDRVLQRVRKRNLSYPKDVPDPWMKHLQNVTRITEPDSQGNQTAKYVETKKGRPDHLLHSIVYADAAGSKAGGIFNWDLDPDPSFNESTYSPETYDVEVEEEGWNEGFGHY